MVAVYIFAALGILVALLSLIVLFITILPSIIAEFALFKWSIQQAIEVKRQRKELKKQNKTKDTTTQQEVTEDKTNEEDLL